MSKSKTKQPMNNFEIKQFLNAAGNVSSAIDSIEDLGLDKNSAKLIQDLVNVRRDLLSAIIVAGAED